MKTIQDKIIQLMEEKCLNFQKECQYEKELEKELQTTGKIIEVIIDGIPYNSRWVMDVYVSCGNATEVTSKLKELFPTAKFDDNLNVDDDISLVTAHIEGKIKREQNVDKNDITKVETHHELKLPDEMYDENGYVVIEHTLQAFWILLTNPKVKIRSNDKQLQHRIDLYNESEHPNLTLFAMPTLNEFIKEFKKTKE